MALPSSPRSTKLCRICEKFQRDLWLPFNISYRIEEMQENCKHATCDLCALLLKVCEKRRNAQHPTISFRRRQSSILMDGAGTPVISIYRSKDLSTRIDNDIQIGFPQLPLPGSAANFEIIRQWIQHCQSSHSSTCHLPIQQGSSQSQTHGPSGLPTRVIEVGRDGDGHVRLIETSPNDSGEWVALSHQWGRTGHYCTTSLNLKDHLRGIPFDHLPATFRDAVKVVRALKRPYLWIDSLCIIQGSDGDFGTESKRMEQVYSGACCVLAISREPGHDAGFLQGRELRDSVALQQPGKSAPFFLCETIDDFHLHVEQGRLNQRGWVLQEHALARRTVYFTMHQMYFECGDGVRCETMTKMTNKIASFLGDPNFPQAIMSADQGEKILLYQDLYSRYSSLGFSRPPDRAIGIAGLEARILTTLNVVGGFGILDDSANGIQGGGLLRRSLLWCRAAEVDNLRCIAFSREDGYPIVPSWSWMAYSGAIDYIKPEFGAMEWDNMQSPWVSNSPDVSIHGANNTKQYPLLIALARDFNAQLSSNNQSNIILDSPDNWQDLPTKCVILGKPRGRKSEKEKLHYVLLVTEMENEDSVPGPVYRRVGVGILPGKCVMPDAITVSIR